jgi:hypothetical protein
MPHYEFFCQPAIDLSQRRWLPPNTRKARLSVRAVGAKKWSRDGSTQSPPSGAPKQHDRSQATFVAFLFPQG